MKYSVFFAHALEAAQQEKLSIDVILQKIKAMGYSGFECEYNPKATGLSEPHEMLKVIKKNELEVASFYYFLDGAHSFDEDEVKEFYRFAYENGVKNTLIIPGMISPEDNHDVALAKILETEKYCVKLAETYGIQVTMEDFDSIYSPFSTLNGLKYFFDNIPELKHAFDSGNYYYSGEDCLKAFELFPDRISYVHLKDRALIGDEDEIDKADINGQMLYACAVGDGVIDIAECIRKIKSLGYDGWIAVEHFASKHMLSCIEKSINNIRVMFKNV